jgi:hypothetical protein
MTIELDRREYRGRKSKPFSGQAMFVNAAAKRRLATRERRFHYYTKSEKTSSDFIHTNFRKGRVSDSISQWYIKTLKRVQVIDSALD